MEEEESFRAATSCGCSKVSSGMTVIYVRTCLGHCKQSLRRPDGNAAPFFTMMLPLQKFPFTKIPSAFLQCYRNVGRFSLLLGLMQPA